MPGSRIRLLASVVCLLASAVVYWQVDSSIVDLSMTQIPVGSGATRTPAKLAALDDSHGRDRQADRGAAKRAESAGSNANEAGASVAPTSPSGDAAGSTASELAQLRRELGALREQVRVLDVVVDDMRFGTPADELGSADLAAVEAELDGLREEAQFEVEDRLLDLDWQFDQESRDEAWSTSMESDVTEAVAAHIPDGSSLLDVECRDTLCRLRVEHSSVDTHKQNSELLPLALATQVSKVVVRHETAHDGTVTSWLYLERRP